MEERATDNGIQSYGHSPDNSARVNVKYYFTFPHNQAITQKTSFRDHEHRELHAERESYARWSDRRSSVWRNLRPACGGCHEVRQIGIEVELTILKSLLERTDELAAKDFVETI